MNQNDGQDSLDIFVSRLLRAKGQSDEPSMHAKLLEKLNDKIDNAILMALPGDRLDYLEQSIDDGTLTEDGVRSVLNSSGIDSEAVITGVLEEFRDDYLTGALAW